MKIPLQLSCHLQVALLVALTELHYNILKIFILDGGTNQANPTTNASGEPSPKSLVTLSNVAPSVEQNDTIQEHESKSPVNVSITAETADSNTSTEKNKENVNANIATTSGIIASGIGYSQFEEIMSAMDVPVFSTTFFAQLQKQVYEKWEMVATESMEAAAMREKIAAIAEVQYHNKATDKTKNDSIPLLHDNIANSLAHAYGIHRMGKSHYCDKEQNDKNDLPKIQNSTFLFRMNAIICTVAAKSRTLIENVDTNAVERFNSVVAKFVGELERRRSLKRKINMTHPTKKYRKIHVTNLQHDYGANSSAPDMSTTEIGRAKQNFIDSLKVDDRDHIERSTILQADSSDWLEIRKKIITASVFGSICKKKPSSDTSTPLGVHCIPRTASLRPESTSRLQNTTRLGGTRNSTTQRNPQPRWRSSCLHSRTWWKLEKEQRDQRLHDLVEEHFRIDALGIAHKSRVSDVNSRATKIAEQTLKKIEGRTRWDCPGSKTTSRCRLVTTRHFAVLRRSNRRWMPYRPSQKSTPGR
ncbi:unnamed protein product, partial [Brenthis ino]